MKITKTSILGFIGGVVVIAVALVFFLYEPIFFFLIGIGALVLIMPFFIGLIVESKKEKEMDEQFLEFSRNLAESVKTGTPIGKSIIHMSEKNYGSLTPYIRKLANQITLGIPTSRAFNTFAQDVGSRTVKRAVTLIQEAESAGGEIDYILDSVAESVSQIEKLKIERKSSVSNLVVQGYIIFLVFVGIMLVMQFKILPLTSGIAPVGSLGGLDNTLAGADNLGGLANSADAAANAEKLARPFLYLLLTQGICAGLTIGKISEGKIKNGIKHSIILLLLSFLIWSGANAFIG
ncbi:MAG: type II secretion system F family protein [Nanoarchaeota archaeon]